MPSATSITKRVKMPATRWIFRFFKETDSSVIMISQLNSPSDPLIVKQAQNNGMKLKGLSPHTGDASGLPCRRNLRSMTHRQSFCQGLSYLWRKFRINELPIFPSLAFS
jgi:hypothetical protein